MLKKFCYYLGFLKGEFKVKSGFCFFVFSYKWLFLSFLVVNNDGGSFGGNGLVVINNVIKKFILLF